jgi:hypothetical protein
MCSNNILEENPYKSFLSTILKKTKIKTMEQKVPKSLHACVQIIFLKRTLMKVFSPRSFKKQR